MTFLNAVLLGGMAAASIPIIIHLFHRSRFRIVQWGAMHLLESVLRKNTRRLKLEQLILLLIRCCIPVALALLMARPVMMGLEPLLGNAKTSTLLVVDNSYSMEAGGANSSAFTQAKEAARAILDNQVEGSDVGIIQMAGGVSVLLDEPTFDLDRLRGELGRTGAGFGSASVPEALDVAAGVLAEMNYPYREVVVLSDFQKISWGAPEAPARARLADMLRKAGPVEPKLTLFHVGEEEKENISVQSLDLSRMILGVGQELRVRAKIRNHGNAPYPDLRAVFLVDGKERDVQEIPLEANTTHDVLFKYTFAEAGSHFIEVFANADLLGADNRMMRSIPVWDRVPVLLVSGDMNPEFLRGETDFVEIALQPYAATKGLEGVELNLADLIQTQVVDARELNAKMLAGSRVALLANVPQLSDGQLKAVEAFVREGGGLLVFPGNRINSGWYNNTFSSDGRGLLPLKVASLAGSMNRRGTHATIVSSHYDHPALEMFNNPRNGNLADAQIRLWYKMRDDVVVRGGDSDVTVLARLDTGDPFLVEKPFGEGRIIQCAVPCDAEWTNLPVKAFYLPLMQQLVTYLASRVDPARNVEVGQPIVALLPQGDAGKKAVLTGPDGVAHDLRIKDKGTRAVAEYGLTQQPGLYVLQAPDNQVFHFVVNTDRRESDLERLTPPEIEAVAKGMGAEVVGSWGEYRDLERTRRFGQEIWKFLLVALLCLMFLEMVLQQFFAKKKI